MNDKLPEWIYLWSYLWENVIWLIINNVATYAALSKLFGIYRWGEVETPGVACWGIFPIHKTFTRLSYPRSCNTLIQFSARTTFPTEYAFWKLKFPKRPLAHLAAPASRPVSCPPRRRKNNWKYHTQKKITRNSPGCCRRWCGRPAGGHLRHRRCWPAPSPRWPAATWPSRSRRWSRETPRPIV